MAESFLSKWTKAINKMPLKTTTPALGADDMDDEKLAAQAKEWAIVFGAIENTAFEVPAKLLNSVADRILSLREENARLRSGLTELIIAFSDSSNFESDLERARAALTPSPTQRSEG